MSLSLPHTFAFSCLPLGFLSTYMSLADHKATQSEKLGTYTNMLLAYLWWSCMVFA